MLPKHVYRYTYGSASITRVKARGRSTEHPAAIVSLSAASAHSTLGPLHSRKTTTLFLLPCRWRRRCYKVRRKSSHHLFSYKLGQSSSRLPASSLVLSLPIVQLAFNDLSL